MQSIYFLSSSLIHDHFWSKYSIPLFQRGCTVSYLHIWIVLFYAKLVSLPETVAVPYVRIIYIFIDKNVDSQMQNFRGLNS